MDLQLITRAFWAVNHPRPQLRSDADKEKVVGTAALGRAVQSCADCSVGFPVPVAAFV